MRVGIQFGGSEWERNDGAMDDMSAVLTVGGEGRGFAVADIGRVVWVYGAGASGGVLKTTVAGYVSTDRVTLVDPNVSGSVVRDALVQWRFPDANNDFHRLDECHVANTRVGVVVDDSQIYGLLATNCRVSAAGPERKTQHSLWIKHGSMRWLGGFMGNTAVSDIHIDGLNPGGFCIENTNHEGGARFLTVAGPSGQECKLRVRNVHFAADRLHEDREAIIIKQPGPICIEDSSFGVDPTKPVRFRWEPMVAGPLAQERQFSFNRNRIKTSDTLATPLEEIFLSNLPTELTHNIIPNYEGYMGGGHLITRGGRAVSSQTTTGPAHVVLTPASKIIHFAETDQGDVKYTLPALAECVGVPFRFVKKGSGRVTVVPVPPDRFLVDVAELTVLEDGDTCSVYGTRDHWWDTYCLA